ncbi:uncharacterized protein LOC122576605 [Bombus pyrosoma]|uniref:uncharacterized protein LOC122576605 n=1 Tax=Bombus pyrosoma TaxID=396416 RepID=UPI001CB90363|nr:uncharacterized protein LOC122576605 [Bombus pyrosoma]XP_043603120.1 uncharacterized protein LOC122576605 [Bombus pyrosoma]
MSKLFSVFVTLLLVQTAWSSTSHDKNIRTLQRVLANSVTYYDPNTGTELDAEITNLKQNNSIATKIYQRSLCHCEENSCNCCVGIRFFRFNGPVCIRITINEDSKAVITANGNTILTHYFRAHPRPVCVSLSSLVNICGQFDFHYVNDHLRSCTSISLQFLFLKFSGFQFPCVQIGDDGISMASLGLLLNQIGTESEQQVTDSEIYDEVDFEQQDLEVHDNHMSMLTPEQEAQIGQLKLRSLRTN